MPLFPSDITDVFPKNALKIKSRVFSHKSLYVSELNTECRIVLFCFEWFADYSLEWVSNSCHMESWGGRGVSNSALEHKRNKNKETKQAFK